ncbi:hypothetical protein ABID34_004266 [Chryseobacterium limigenitum]
MKNINIGQLIKIKWEEMEIPIERTCNFLSCTEKEIDLMFESENLSTEKLLRWSKLLQYDFFRLYSQHLILYAPQGKADRVDNPSLKKTVLPQFRKHIYTKEIIYFIIELINTGAKTKLEVIHDYKIPKTTLYKWLDKYSDLAKNNIKK